MLATRAGESPEALQPVVKKQVPVGHALKVQMTAPGGAATAVVGAVMSLNVTTPVSADGTVCTRSTTQTNIAVDINGWFAVSTASAPPMLSDWFSATNAVSAGNPARFDHDCFEFGLVCRSSLDVFGRRDE